MTEYALIIGGEFKEIRQYETRPDDIKHKQVEWVDVARESGEVFAGIEGGKYVIRTPSPIPSRRMVEKWVVMDRLTDEQLEAAMSLMSVRQQEKWRMPGYPSVYADDPEVVQLIKAIGADPEAVLA